MAERKSERIMNLAICLLMARRFLPKTELRRMVEGYGGLNDDAFERMFERDKDELRAMGVPVETGSNDVLFPDEVGYRIRREVFELPPISFTADEAAALGLAAQAWGSAARADEAVSALAKLRAAGIDPDAARAAAITPSVGARETAFDPLWEAVNGRIPVTFVYRGRTRHLQPWGMRSRHGAWYVAGFDTDAEEPRVYKLVRVDGTVSLDRRHAPFERADDVDVQALFDAIEPIPDAHAVVAVRHGRAAPLRRRSEPVARSSLPPGYEAFDVPYASRDGFVGELSELGADVLVLEPRDLRDALLAHLREVVR